MDLPTFKNIIAANGGEANLLGIMMSSGGKIIFDKAPFSYAVNLDETNQCVKLTQRDVTGVEFTVVRDVNQIESLTFINDIANIDRINWRSLAN